LAADIASDREGLDILRLWILARARSTQERDVSVQQISGDVPVEGIELGFSCEVLGPLRGCGILEDLVDGLEIEEIDRTSLRDLEVGSHIVLDGHTYGVDMEANVSFAKDCETKGEYKNKLVKSFH
jgi:hypothetical protein